MGNLTDKKTKRCCDEEAMLARREEILETATELFAEHGFSDAVTQVLADRLQIGKGTIYRHFPSKRELFLAAADRVMVKLNERVEASIAGVADGLERVARAIAAYLAFFAEHPQFVELIIQERAHFKDRKRPTYFEHRERTVLRWRQLYREMIAAGRVREMPVEQITEVVSGAIYGTMFINYFTGQAKPSDEQAREIVEVVYRGILSDSERRCKYPAAGGPAGAAPGRDDEQG
jgi:AcrR family transcriptional regulator